jgi:hypothetical protein
MATGASSQLAGLCGVRAAAAPLLWLAIVEAAGIAVLGIVRRGAHGRVRLASWLRLGVPSEHMGELTVPLGLAVTATGLAAQRGAFASSLLPVCCVLASLAAVALFARVLAAVAISGWRLEAVDGGWFLTSAVLSGASIAATTIAATTCGLHSGAACEASLRWLASVAAVGGLAGYWAVTLAAVLRVSRYGLAGSRPALWWISAGSGGLAVAAAAKVLGVPGGDRISALAEALRTATAVTWVMATVVLVPIVVQSARFLLRGCPVMRAVPWPPAFSSAVFSLGTLGVGALFHVPVITAAGEDAGRATLVLWAVTTFWNAAVLSRGIPRPSDHDEMHQGHRDAHRDAAA